MDVLHGGKLPCRFRDWLDCGVDMGRMEKPMSDLPQRLRLNATIPLVMEAVDRIEALEAALRGIAEDYSWVEQIQRTVRTALAGSQDK